MSTFNPINAPIMKLGYKTPTGAEYTREFIDNFIEYFMTESTKLVMSKPMSDKPGAEINIDNVLGVVSGLTFNEVRNELIATIIPRTDDASLMLRLAADTKSSIRVRPLHENYNEPYTYLNDQSDYVTVLMHTCTVDGKGKTYNTHRPTIHLRGMLTGVVPQETKRPFYLLLSST